MAKAAAIVAAARALVGVPFLHQGRNPQVGLDCVGVVAAVALPLGLAERWMDRADYPRIPDREVLARGLREFCTGYHASERGPVHPGTILVFDFLGEPIHCGWCCGDTVVHAYSPSGAVVEHPIPGRWERRLRSVWVPEGLNG